MQHCTVCGENRCDTRPERQDMKSIICNVEVNSELYQCFTQQQSIQQLCEVTESYFLCLYYSYKKRAFGCLSVN